MAGIKKHGAHRYFLTTAATAAGTAAQPAIWTYDAYSGPQSSITGSGGLDSTSEVVTEMVLTLGTALTGQATNFTTFRVTHRNAAGTTVDQFTVVASTTSFVFGAFVAADLAIASGGTIPGGGTGTLTIGTGSALPWNLVNGDTITLDTTVTGTGQYTGGIGLSFVVQSKGA
jgi:hypothetical protein